MSAYVGASGAGCALTLNLNLTLNLILIFNINITPNSNLPLTLGVQVTTACQRMWLRVVLAASEQMADHVAHGNAAVCICKFDCVQT